MSTARVRELGTYPVKSCEAIYHQDILVTKRGLHNDRKCMVVDPDGRMMTQREHPRMALIHPHDLIHEKTNIVRKVSVWKSVVSAYDQGDAAAEWLTNHLGTPCRLVQMVEGEVRKTKRGDGLMHFADGYSILGTSVESLGDLNSRAASRVPMDRFRANIVFEGGNPFEEDTWRRIRIGGGVELVGETLCARCSIPSINQDTAERGKEPGMTLAKYRRAQHITAPEWKLPYPSNVYFGRNFVVAIIGVIEVGMEVEILETD